MAGSGVTQIEFDEIEVSVKRYMSHPYLHACHIPQSVSRFHFDVAHVILQAAHVPIDQMKLVLESVLLLEQGLAIHDGVDNLVGKQRQLTVLSGDYNSSHYYFVLSKLNDVKLLHALSEAVVRINQAKMALIRDTAALSVDQYMTLFEEIRGGLLQALAVHYLGASSTTALQLVPLIRAHVVEEEMNTKSVPRFFTFRQAYEWLTENRERVMSLPANAILTPISTLIHEYFTPLRSRLESLKLAEGNHR